MFLGEPRGLDFVSRGLLSNCGRNLTCRERVVEWIGKKANTEGRFYCRVRTKFTMPHFRPVCPGKVRLELKEKEYGSRGSINPMSQKVYTTRLMKTLSVPCLSYIGATFGPCSSVQLFLREESHGTVRPPVFRGLHWCDEMRTDKMRLSSFNECWKSSSLDIVLTGE